MKLNYFTLAALFFIPLSGTAQSENGYQFTTVVQQKATPVKDQAVSGTCWCFATTSFIESELLRQGKGEYDLSEMFIVRQKHGKGNVTQGSITASWITAFNQVGIVPEEAYTGINYDSPVHNHSELAGYVEAISAEAVKQKKNSKQYQELANSLFDIYMGKVPETFTYKGKEYTPKSFAESLGIDTDDYIPLTSFTHKPYYKPFEVEIPDNWEHSQMYNLPLDELINVMDGALKSGYTLCWDGDVSEKGFAYLNGVAINPDVKSDDLYKDSDRAHWGQLNDTERLAEVFRFEHPYPEVKVTPEIRQQGYESGKTTDDHLMHITGIATDQNGTKYYITKNSWAADSNDFGGYLNMSESYVRAKTIYILVHKDALPKTLKEKLGI